LQAFSTAQVIEHEFLVHKNRNIEVSVQELVDCDTENQACDGGWPGDKNYKFKKKKF
jgi:hypothetical protein